VTDALFRHEADAWHPHEEAGGPFGGLHGGAVSGLLLAIMERAARERAMGAALSASVLLLRPAPMAPLSTAIEVLRQGGRVGVLEASLVAEGKLIAKATASFVTELPVEGAPATGDEPYDPASLPVWPVIRRFPHKTLFDALDIRVDGVGGHWGRLKRPLLDSPSPLADAFAVADCATAFYLAHRKIMPRWGFPNLDIALHLSRPPEGAWLGVDAQSDWRPEGRGITQSQLRDTRGPIGRACQSIVLTPRA
jgi:acyl-CoA thioesterase